MSGTRISVAMATYNGERFLQEQLDSLAAQTYLPYELVVGDDGSTDGTLDILERFARTAPFPVRICRNPVNLGFGANFLSTASRCAGDWIAFCDQDDIWLPEKLSTCVRILRRHPQVSLFVHEITACDEQLCHQTSRVAEYWISRIMPPLSGSFRIVRGCSMIYRRNLLDVVTAEIKAEFFRPGTLLPHHDLLINLIGYCTAFRYECRNVLLLYRRHTDAVTAAISPSRRGRLRRVRSTTSELYLNGRDTAQFIAKWYRDCAESTPEIHREAFLAAAGLFEMRARLYERRGELYAASGITKRVQIFSHLIRDKAYLKEFTVRDHVKDFLRTLASGNTNPAELGSECN